MVIENKPIRAISEFESTVLDLAESLGCTFADALESARHLYRDQFEIFAAAVAETLESA